VISKELVVLPQFWQQAFQVRVSAVVAAVALLIEAVLALLVETAVAQLVAVLQPSQPVRSDAGRQSHPFFFSKKVP
jgi:hypothetical protein